MQIELTNARRSAAAFSSCVHAAQNQNIDVRDPAQIARLSRELGVTWLQLFRIIDRVGVNIRAVRNAVLNQHGVVWH